ncbi:hypothetical protein, partial [Klebsiella pneumoniae]|uniref:hypothetical protein n=2 Tax=Klebsiella pneumoniae TaxID=573 RepID=UPI001D0DC282
TLWGQSSSAAGQGQRARSRFFAGWRLTPYPAYKNRAARTLLVACPGPRLRSATGQLLRLLLRLRQLADNRRAPRIPFRQPGQ